MVNEAKKKMQKARKGFTLVELLIVIIIIGILAGAMMLVAGTSRDSAEASKIISDLRTVKTAALMLITEDPTIDNDKWEGIKTDTGMQNLLNKYLDRPIDFSNYEFKVASAEVPETDPAEIVSVWLLGMGVGTRREGVKSNLTKQAESAGLLGSTGDTPTLSSWPPVSDDLYNNTAGDKYVWVTVQ